MRKNPEHLKPHKNWKCLVFSTGKVDKTFLIYFLPYLRYHLLNTNSQWMLTCMGKTAKFSLTCFLKCLTKQNTALYNTWYWTWEIWAIRAQDVKNSLHFKYLQFHRLCVHGIFYGIYWFVQFYPSGLQMSWLQWAVELQSKKKCETT